MKTISAMIFAAGLGTRLYPLTADKPKALVEFQGKPLLDHVLRKIIEADIRHIVVNVHHFPDLIINYLKERHYEAEIVVSDEREYLRDTGGGLKYAAPLLADSENILLHNVDILSDLDLKHLIAYHENHDALATLAVRQRNSSRYFLFDEAMKFMGVILLGAPIMSASMVINNQMRFQGNATQAMYGMISGAVLNVVLVPLFMFTFGLGILGTAIGTVLSQLFGFIVLWVMSRRGENIPIDLSQSSRKWHFQKEILKGGTPSLTRQALASIATLMLNVAAGVYGDAAIAGMSIVSRLAFIIFAIIIGVGQGYQPFCGFNYGAGLYKRLRKGFYFTILLDMAVLLVMCGPAFVFAEQLVNLLRNDPEVVAVGAIALRWQLVALPMAAVVTVCNMTLQTTGQSLSANILAAARNGIFFIPLILILPRMMGLFGVEICQAVCDVLAFLLAIPLTIRFFRSLPRK